MKAVVVFLLIVGIFFIMQGIHQQKIREIEKNKRIEYRFVPRTYLEEQMAEANVYGKISSIFTKESPWFERTVSLPKENR